MKTRVQRNDYLGYPDVPKPESKEQMVSMLKNVLDQRPPDAEKISKIWRLLTDQSAPKSFRPGPRRPRS